MPYKVQQTKGFYIPKALKSTVIKLVKDRKRKEVLEDYYKPYRNPYFLVRKKNKGYRLINIAININRVTIKDINLLPLSNKFLEKFTKIYIISLINQFSGYN